MATITIIVPVYKAEKFIRHTIHSVKEQTFTDWELILVIDGSPDDSAGICKEIAANDKRIRVLEQENLGVNRARQNGLHHCTTPFITLKSATPFPKCYLIKKNGLLIRKTAIKSSRPFQCAYYPLTPQSDLRQYAISGHQVM